MEGVRPAANLAPGEGCFDLDPGTLVAAERDARARGLEIVGIWHSHADAAARLSRADLAVAYDGWLHAVTAVERGSVRELRAFRVDDGRPCEEALAP